MRVYHETSCLLGPAVLLPISVPFSRGASSLVSLVQLEEGYACVHSSAKRWSGLSTALNHCWEAVVCLWEGAESVGVKLHGS